MLIHPAHTLPFDELVAGLRSAREQRLVYERPGPDDLVLYLYSEHCVYEGSWTPITLAARGLIVDLAARRIVATPFPKFFNAGERGEPIPDLAFETTEKLDGSLIIIFHHRGRWRTATKGAFNSAQALWAQGRLDTLNLSSLKPGTTYLAEATYAENRIVVHYADPALRMLAAYGETGCEVAWTDLVGTSEAVGIEPAARFEYGSLSDLIEKAKILPRTEEGFVLRFANGLRLKIKGNEYKRIHALVSNLTPLAMWQAMAAGMDMASIRRELPEEFWADFDSIIAILDSQIRSIVDRVAATARAVQDLPDKEVGLRLATFDDAVRSFIFMFRKSGGDLLSGRNREKVFRAIRPTNNELAGYVPSYAMNRVNDESG